MKIDISGQDLDIVPMNRMGDGQIGTVDICGEIVLVVGTGSSVFGFGVGSGVGSGDIREWSCAASNEHAMVGRTVTLLPPGTKITLTI